jgi:hypothetical protein
MKRFAAVANSGRVEIRTIEGGEVVNEIRESALWGFSGGCGREETMRDEGKSR